MGLKLVSSKHSREVIFTLKFLKIIYTPLLLSAIRKHRVRMFLRATSKTSSLKRLVQKVHFFLKNIETTKLIYV